MTNTKFERAKSKLVEEIKSVFEVGQKDRGKLQTIFANSVSSGLRGRCMIFMNR
jgi:hypothetical protein